jgi:hypothetical protein
MSSAANPKLPLPRKGTGGRFGAILPSDSSVEARAFFREGKPYTFSSSNLSTQLKVKGVFTSPSDAESRYPEVSGSWYTLSSSEIKNLGRGPWLPSGGRK